MAYSRHARVPNYCYGRTDMQWHISRMPTLLLPKLPHGGRYAVSVGAADQAWHSAVVIPARNEVDRILSCLEAIRCQWSVDGRSLAGQFVTVVVVNGTTDATCGEVVRWHASHPTVPLVLVDIDFPAAEAHVGSARSLGMEIAASLLEQNGTGERMLLSTDADTRLAPNAVAEAYAWLERGADAVGAHILAGEADPSQIGAVINAYRALHAALRYRYYRGALDTQPTHGDFGGAGFGVSLEAYRQVGGLPIRSYDEDQLMRRRLLDAGQVVAYPRSFVVYTSTRTDGRAEWGMAKQLAAWENDYAEQKWPLMPCVNGLVWKYALKASLREGRPPINYFDPSGRLVEAWGRTDTTAPFEARWRAFWSDADTVQLREARFPKRPLPEAYATLKAAFGEGQLLAAKPLALAQTRTTTPHRRIGIAA